MAKKALLPVHVTAMTALADKFPQSGQPIEMNRELESARLVRNMSIDVGRVRLSLSDCVPNYKNWGRRAPDPTGYLPKDKVQLELVKMNKKISFGFSNIKKKNVIISQKPIEANQVEFIESIQGQTIKLKNEEEKVEQGPLVIPVKADGKNLIDRIMNTRNKKEIKKEEESGDVRPDSELSIDELAAREVIRDVKNRENSKNRTTEKVYLLPKVEDKLIIEGEPEPTLDDYENVPIGDYGLAMLRGMGWSESTGIGRNPSTGVKAVQPELRPKGLGLGAIRMVESKPKEVVDKDGKELVLKSKTYAKIVAGRFRGQYCQVQCLDEDGRVIVKTTLKGEVLTLNEIFVTPVTKEEYMECSKVLNIAKYEDFKNNSKKDNESENCNPKKHPDKQNDLETSSERHRSEKKNYSDDDSECKRKSSHQSKDRHRTKKKSADRNDSSDDDSEYERKSSYKHKGKSKYRDKSRSRSNERFYKKKLTKSKIRRKSTSSSSDSEYEKKKKSSKSSHRRHRRHGHSDSDSDSTSKHRSRK